MDVFDLVAKISLDTTEYEKNLQETKQETQTATSKWSDGFKKFKTGAKVALAAVGAGVVALTKTAVEKYADYEQLIGGVKKLYGDAWESVVDNAKRAYKTAGLSANEYMETATQFSASLISSLNGNQQEAAALTDKAMQDMSDNVNTFGSNMEDVMNAYKGFSKQNYTMLDNLKLGYGGTKTEMERLISDSAKAKDAQKALNLTVDEGSLSFDNIVKAIEVAQYQQGIYGTTAKEASTTISGSIQMTKKAWENLLTGLADGEADIDELVDDLIESAGYALDNLMPVIERALAGIGKLVVKFLPKLVAAVVAMLPELMSALWDGIVQAFKDSSPIGKVALAGVFAAVIADGLTKALPIIQKTVDMGKWFAGLFGTSTAASSGGWLAKMMTDASAKATTAAAGVGKFSTASATAASVAGKLATGVGTVTAALPLLVGMILPARNALKYYTAKAQGNTKAMQEMSKVTEESAATMASWGGIAEETGTQGMAGIRELVQNFKTGFKNIGSSVVTAKNTVVNTMSRLWSEMKTGASSGLATVKTSVSGGLASVVNAFETNSAEIKNNNTATWNAIDSTLTAKWNGLASDAKTKFAQISTNVALAWKTVKDNSTTSWSGILADLSVKWGTIKSNASTSFTNIVSAVSAAWQNVKANSITIWSGIGMSLSTSWNAIKTNATTLFSSIKTTISTSWQNVKTSTTTSWQLMSQNTSTSLSAMASTVSQKMGSIKNSLSQGFSNIGTSWGTTLASFKSIVTEKLSGIVEAIQDKTSGIGGAFSNALVTAKNNVSNGLTTIAKVFKSANWSLPSIKLPHFTVTGKFGKTATGSYSTPKISVSWYKKAEDEPYMFGNNATLFGAGDAQDEILYGRSNLLDDIRTAIGGMSVRPINIYVYGSDGMNVNDIANAVSDKLNQELLSQRAVYA